MDYDPAAHGYCPICLGGIRHHRVGCPNDGYDADDGAEKRS